MTLSRKPSTFVYQLLVVTPDVSLGELLESQLAVAGYEVLLALSVTGAIALIRRGERRVHLVIADMQLGSQPIDDLVDHVRRTHPGIRCVCLASWGEQATCRAADSVLVKPFTNEQLITEIQSVLRGGGELR